MRRRMRLLRHLKASVGSQRAYVFASDCFWQCRDAWKNLEWHVRQRTRVSLSPRLTPLGHVLLSYIIDPFLDPSRRAATNHTNYWEAVEMAQAYLDLGFAVDVIGFPNQTYVPDKPYDLVIDSRHNLQRLASKLPNGCVKVFHGDTSHITFHNAAEARRLLDLQTRRGVTLQPRRFERPNLAIEHADCVTLLGNEATERTYRYANKSIYRLPVPSTVRWPWPDHKDWSACRRRFVFLASGGLVHKGLDLVLEAFAAMREYELYICAPVDPRPVDRSAAAPSRMYGLSVDTNRFAHPDAMYREQDFRVAYAKELYDTPNIHTLGWVDLASSDFQSLIQSCAGIIHPSCAEGASTSLVTGMHAALAPIATYESGVDIDLFGHLLKVATVDEIQHAVVEMVNLPLPRFKAMARAAWESANSTHTRDHYAETYRRVAEDIVQRIGAKGP